MPGPRKQLYELYRFENWTWVQFSVWEEHESSKGKIILRKKKRSKMVVTGQVHSNRKMEQQMRLIWTENFSEENVENNLLDWSGYHYESNGNEVVLKNKWKTVNNSLCGDIWYYRLCVNEMELLTNESQRQEGQRKHFRISEIWLFFYLFRLVYDVFHPPPPPPR